MSRQWDSSWCLAAIVVACQVLTAVAITIQPCRPITPLTRGSPFEVGLVFWPGGLEEQWGNTTSGLQPCDPAVMANLTAQGAMFAAYNVRADRLTMLKTTFPEELILTGRSPSTAPKVISVVAFRNYVRSDVRYIASFDPSITKGAGFVSSLALLAKFETGTLKYLQFYNLTCNDCGGRLSSRCINDTSCALDFSVCTCASTTTAATNTGGRRLMQAASNSTTTNGTTAATTSSCNYANFSFCATSINFAFEGVDSNSAAFKTGSQIRKLNSYSVLSLYFQAKAAFMDVKGMFTDTAGTYWGNFGAVQGDIQQAYSGNAAANVDQLSS
eukprot:GHUV01015858.1.p1 GENE.GHUV01015858.1~~GHUV01015858.1.p1  ORF type:complete len:328 (+),score=61.50 GHUV01015858.1:609-1592(+)